MFRIYKFLPYKVAISAIRMHRQSVIEENLHLTNIDITDIFYDHTWSNKFIERNLKPEHTQFWDHISVWYEINTNFARRNIDHLNLHNLYMYQNLPNSFFLKYVDRIDWVAPGAREEFIENLKTKKP